MSFLESLLDVPTDWLHRWRINAEGQVVYVLTEEEIAAERAAREAERLRSEQDDDELPYLRESMIGGTSIAERRDELLRGEDREAVDATPQAAPAEAPAASRGVSQPEEDEGHEVAVGVAEHSADEEHKGHGHKDKDPKEMSPNELASISATCNAKIMKIVIRKGSDGALINALGNPAMDAEVVRKMIEKRGPSATVLTAVGRSRFARDKDVAAAICKSAKTPLHVSRGLIGRLNVNDLKEICRAPSLPQALKAQARSKLERKKKH